VTDGDVPHGGPELRDPLAGQPVEDMRPLAARANEPGPCEDAEVLRRVGDALRDLRRDLVHRPLALREDVDDLCPPPAAESLRHRRQCVEEGGLRVSARHVFKLSLEYLKGKPEHVQLPRARRGGSRKSLP
jgi:hypothetical protein